MLLRSGLNESWWADAMECYTYLRNVTDLLSDGKTPYERRFGQPFKGPITILLVFSAEIIISSIPAVPKCRNNYFPDSGCTSNSIPMSRWIFAFAPYSKMDFCISVPKKTDIFCRPLPHRMKRPSSCPLPNPMLFHAGCVPSSISGRAALAAVAHMRSLTCPSSLSSSGPCRTRYEVPQGATSARCLSMASRLPLVAENLSRTFRAAGSPTCLCKREDVQGCTKALLGWALLVALVLLLVLLFGLVIVFVLVRLLVLLLLLLLHLDASLHIHKVFRSGNQGFATHPPRRTRLAHEAEVAGLRNLTVQGVNVVRLAGGATSRGPLVRARPWQTQLLSPLATPIVFRSDRGEPCSAGGFRRRTL